MRAMRLMKHLNGKFGAESKADLPPELFEAIGKEFGLDSKRLMADTLYFARRYENPPVIPSYEIKTMFLWDLYSPKAPDRDEPPMIVSTLIRWFAALGTRYNVDKGRLCAAIVPPDVCSVKWMLVTFARISHFFFASTISSADVSHSHVERLTDALCAMIGYIESLGTRTDDSTADDSWVMFYKRTDM